MIIRPSRRSFLIGSGAAIAAASIAGPVSTAIFQQPALIRRIFGLEFYSDRPLSRAIPFRLIVRDKVMIEGATGRFFTWSAVAPEYRIILREPDVLRIEADVPDETAAFAALYYEAGGREFEERFDWPGGISRGPIPLAA